MLSKLLGWSPWSIEEDTKVVRERRIWRDCDPYGNVNDQEYWWTGRKVTYRRRNNRTGKVQYRYEEFQQSRAERS